MCEPRRWCTDRANWTAFAEDLSPVGVGSDVEQDICLLTAPIMEPAESYMKILAEHYAIVSFLRPNDRVEQNVLDFGNASSRS